MNSLPLALLGLGAFIVLSGLVAVYVSVRRAPLGFEDGAGFHASPNEVVPIRTQSSTPDRQMGLAFNDGAKRAST